MNPSRCKNNYISNSFYYCYVLDSVPVQTYVMSTATPGEPLTLRHGRTAQRPGGTLTKTCWVPPSCTKQTAPCSTAARPACATPSSLCHHATTSSYVAFMSTFFEYTAAGWRNNCRETDIDVSVALHSLCVRLKLNTTKLKKYSFYFSTLSTHCVPSHWRCSAWGVNLADFSRLSLTQRGCKLV